MESQVKLTDEGFIVRFDAKPNQNGDVFKKGCFTPQPAVNNFSTQIKGE